MTLLEKKGIRRTEERGRERRSGEEKAETKGEGCGKRLVKGKPERGKNRRTERKEIKTRTTKRGYEKTHLH